jgi:hypothetical protein
MARGLGLNQDNCSFHIRVGLDRTLHVDQRAVVQRPSTSNVFQESHGEEVAVDQIRIA